MTMILRKKKTFKQKEFFIIFKERSIKQVTQVFLEGESPTLNYLDFKTLQKLWEQLLKSVSGRSSKFCVNKYSNNPTPKWLFLVSSSVQYKC